MSGSVAALHVWQDEISLADAIAIRDGELGLEEALERGRRRRHAEQWSGAIVAG